MSNKIKFSKRYVPAPTYHKPQDVLPSHSEKVLVFCHNLITNELTPFIAWIVSGGGKEEWRYHDGYLSSTDAVVIWRYIETPDIPKGV